MDVRGVPLSFRERRTADKQKSEGLMSAAVDFGMTAFDVRFRLVVSPSVLKHRTSAVGPNRASPAGW
jgi:hypothetical protein